MPAVLAPRRNPDQKGRPQAKRGTMALADERGLSPGTLQRQRDENHQAAVLRQKQEREDRRRRLLDEAARQDALDDLRVAEEQRQLLARHKGEAVPAPVPPSGPIPETRMRDRASRIPTRSAKRGGQRQMLSPPADQPPVRAASPHLHPRTNREAPSPPIPTLMGTQGPDVADTSRPPPAAAKPSGRVQHSPPPAAAKPAGWHSTEPVHTAESPPRASSATRGRGRASAGAPHAPGPRTTISTNAALERLAEIRMGLQRKQHDVRIGLEDGASLLRESGQAFVARDIARGLARR